jgi:hypothetical protein
MDDYLTWTPNPVSLTDGLIGDVVNTPAVNTGGMPLAAVEGYTAGTTATPETQIAAPEFDPSAFHADMQARQSQNILQPEPNKPLEEKSFFSNLGDSFSATMKKRGGEIFASTMAASAQGVIAYLLQRKKERADRDLENTRNQNKVAETNASVARASAMPKLGSIVKPGVTGQQRTGSGGLISAVQQRGG